MSRRKHRVYYPAVTFSVVVVGFAALVSQLLRPIVPPPGRQGVPPARDPFVQAGREQTIPWRDLDVATLAEARRLQRPIFLLIGDRGSRVGALVDRFTFQSDAEFAERLARRYIPIRVDGLARPYLTTAFDPLLRAQRGWDDRFQVWLLTPSGATIGSVVPLGENADNLQSSLPRTMEWFWDRARDPNFGPAGLPAGVSQRLQAEQLTQSLNASSPDVRGHWSWLRENHSENYGGWVLDGFLRPPSPELRFLRAVGDRSLYMQAATTFATGTMIDWVFGGVFSKSWGPQYQSIDFTKYPIQNAEMALHFAVAYRWSNAPLFRQLAEDGFDLLVTGFQKEGGFASYRRSDYRGNRRSSGSSFSPRQLNDLFTREQQQGLVGLWGLSPSSNPAMLPFVSSPESFAQNQGAMTALLRAMREARTNQKQEYAEEVFCDSSAFVTARLLECARLLGDKAREEQAKAAMESLRRYRSGENDVLRRGLGQDYLPAYLGDAIGYAEASLEAFRTTGDVAWGLDGLRVFERALEVYAGPTEGVLVTSSVEVREDLPPDLVMPEIADRHRPSLSATAVRLAHQYGAFARAFGNREMDNRASRLERFVAASIGHFGTVANEARARTSGFFESAVMAQRAEHITVRGRNAHIAAHNLERRFPGLLVLPFSEDGPLQFELHRGQMVKLLQSPDDVAADLQERTWTP